MDTPKTARLNIVGHLFLFLWLAFAALALSTDAVDNAGPPAVSQLHHHQNQQASGNLPFFSSSFDTTLTLHSSTPNHQDLGSSSVGSVIPPSIIKAIVHASWQPIDTTNPHNVAATLSNGEQPDYLITLKIERPRMASSSSSSSSSSSAEYVEYQGEHSDLVELLDGRVGVFFGFRNGSIPYFLPDGARALARDVIVVPLDASRTTTVTSASTRDERASNTLKGIAAALQFHFAPAKHQRRSKATSQTVTRTMHGAFGPFDSDITAENVADDMFRLRMRASPDRFHNVDTVKGKGSFVEHIGTPFEVRLLSLCSYRFG